jgi:hypothetical protein
MLRLEEVQKKLDAVRSELLKARAHTDVMLRALDAFERDPEVLADLLGNGKKEPRPKKTLADHVDAFKFKVEPGSLIKAAQKHEKPIGTLAALSESILRNTGPLDTETLLDKLSRRGKKVGGKRPVATLYGTLIKAKNIDRNGGKWYAKGVKKSTKT